MAGIGDYIKGGVEDLKKNPVGMIVGVVIVGVLGGITLGFLLSILMVGYYGMILKMKKGGTGEIGDVFSQFNKDAFMIGVPSLAVSLLSYVTSFVIGSDALSDLLELLSLVVALALVWAAPIQATKKGPFMESLMGSVEFWKSEPIGKLIGLVVAGIVGVIGAIACGVGLLATMPIAVSAIMALYLDKSGALPGGGVPAPSTVPTSTQTPQ